MNKASNIYAKIIPVAATFDADVPRTNQLVPSQTQSIQSPTRHVVLYRTPRVPAPTLIVAPAIGPTIEWPTTGVPVVALICTMFALAIPRMNLYLMPAAVATAGNVIA